MEIVDQEDSKGKKGVDLIENLEGANGQEEVTEPHQTNRALSPKQLELATWISFPIELSLGQQIIEEKKNLTKDTILSKQDLLDNDTRSIEFFWLAMNLLQ